MSERHCLGVGTSSKGTSGEMRMTTNLERREIEDETKEECIVATLTHKTDSELLVLLQVNCKSIYNKTFDFWNLIVTYNPEDVIGKEPWLSEEFSNAEVLGLITQLSEETDTLVVTECLWCKKLHYSHRTMG